MIERLDLFHLPFYKKEAFTGSDRGVRFWVGRTEVQQEDKEEETVLRTIMWPEPFALQSTPDEQKIAKDFSIAEEGLDDACARIQGEGRELVLNMRAGI